MYCSVMGLIAAPIAMQSAFPVGLGILVVIAGLVAVIAVGYFIGREYVNRRLHRRHW
jgi:membrane protein DedA with SNARE-associated domain